MNRPKITTLLVDIGNVLLTNGWERAALDELGLSLGPKKAA